MRYVNYIVAIATLAAAVAGCADPYYPRYGNSQTYYSQSGYSYPANSYPVSYSYPANYSYPVSYSYPASYRYPTNYNYPANYSYRSSAWDRNYSGIHPGPERTFP